MIVAFDDDNPAPRPRPQTPAVRAPAQSPGPASAPAASSTRAPGTPVAEATVARPDPASATPATPPGPASVTSTAPATEPVATPEPEPASSTITFRVTSDPVGATVVLDGVRLGVTPFEATLPIEQGAGWLKVRKGKQHAAVKIRVDLAHDVSWDVRLPPLRKRAGN
jgi:hypothetical protein